MALDTDKIDDAVLALLALTLHDGWRAWKGFDWDALDRLHQKGMIDSSPFGANRRRGPRVPLLLPAGRKPGRAGSPGPRRPAEQCGALA